MNLSHLRIGPQYLRIMEVDFLKPGVKNPKGAPKSEDPTNGRSRLPIVAETPKPYGSNAHLRDGGSQR